MPVPTAVDTRCCHSRGNVYDKLNPSTNSLSDERIHKVLVSVLCWTVSKGRGFRDIHIVFDDTGRFELHPKDIEKLRELPPRTSNMNTLHFQTTRKCPQSGGRSLAAESANAIWSSTLVRAYCKQDQSFCMGTKNYLLWGR